jgi:hypothetical protein
MIEIHAIAPVGLRDDIVHQRASRIRPLRAFTEVFAVAQTPWVDNAQTGRRRLRRVHDRLVAMEATGDEPEAASQRQRTACQVGSTVAGPRSCKICGPQQSFVSAQRGYRHAIDEFVEWYCSEPRLSFSKTVVVRYRMHLESRQLAPGTINLRLVRRLAYEAADCGLLSAELTTKQITTEMPAQMRGARTAWTGSKQRRAESLAAVVATIQILG